MNRPADSQTDGQRPETISLQQPVVSLKSGQSLSADLLALRDVAGVLLDLVRCQGAALGWNGGQITTFQQSVKSIRDAAQAVLDRVS